MPWSVAGGLALGVCVGACTDRDDTHLLPIEASAPPPVEASAPPAEEPATSVMPPVVESPPTSVVEQPPVNESNPPVTEPPGTSGPPPVGNDACAPVVAPETLGLRAALVPFEQRCGAGGLTRAGAQALVRVPYLQRLSTNAVDILYKRRRTGEDVVDVSLPNGTVVAQVPTTVDTGAPDGLQRLARIENLTPATYYCYAVAGLTERIGFRTAPAPGADAVVRFAVFGDSGDGGVGQAAVRDRLLALPIDLVLHTGDVAYDTGTIDQFEKNFFRFYEGLLKSVAIFPIPGNHEYYTSAAAPFIEVFDLPENGGVAGRERWYSFDFGDVHFVGLDTEQLGADQVAWLEQDLSSNQRRWTVVYFHKPPFSSGYHGNAPAVEQAFVPILQSHAVPIVFAGHEHSYERTLPMGGVTYVITGGGGKLIRAVGSSDFTVTSRAALHVVEVEVRGATMQVRALDVSGAAIDSFELTAPN